MTLHTVTGAFAFKGQLFALRGHLDPYVIGVVFDWAASTLILGMLSPHRTDLQFWTRLGLGSFWTCDPQPACFDIHWPPAALFVFFMTVGFVTTAWLARRSVRAGTIARAILALVVLAMSMIFSFLLYPPQGDFRHHDNNAFYRRVYTATMMMSCLLAIASVALVYKVWVVAQDVSGTSSTQRLTLRALRSRPDTTPYVR